MFKVLTHRLTLRGFIVRDYDNQQAEFLSDTANWLKSGEIQYREDFVEGLETAPEALIGLLKGNNFGKLVVRVSPDPTA
jgi:NADPH-dependent curcumin reductase CurA